MNKNICKNDLIETYGNKIAVLSRRMISNGELAEEAVQETWYEVFKGMDSFMGNSSIGTWIYTIARRTILRVAHNEKVFPNDALKKYLELPELEFHDQAESNRYQWVSEKCYDCITAFFHCLNNDDRLTFIFREILNLSYQKIAQIMEENPVNLRQRISRSKSKIKNFLNEYCTLYNPSGNCTCRMKKQVKTVHFDRAFLQIEKAASLIHFFEKLEETYPKKDYWKKKILNCHN